MEKQELVPNDQTTDAQPSPRSWVTPLFERTELKKALTGSRVPNLDIGPTDYS